MPEGNNSLDHRGHNMIAQQMMIGVNRNLLILEE